MSAKKPAGSDTGTGWLDALEDRVRQAAERLRELGAENDRLRAEVARLEAELAAAASTEAEPAAAAEAEAWREERTEVRRRIEGLVERLGELLKV